MKRNQSHHKQLSQYGSGSGKAKNDTHESSNFSSIEDEFCNEKQIKGELDTFADLYKLFIKTIESGKPLNKYLAFAIRKIQENATPLKIVKTELAGLFDNLFIYSLLDQI